MVQAYVDFGARFENEHQRVLENANQDAELHRDWDAARRRVAKFSFAALASVVPRSGASVVGSGLQQLEMQAIEPHELADAATAIRFEKHVEPGSGRAVAKSHFVAAQMAT